MMRYIKLILLLSVFMMIQMLAINGQENVNPINAAQNDITGNNMIEAKEVLVIYDNLAIGTANSNNLNSLETLLSDLAQTAEITTIDDYQAGRMMDYQKVIIMKNTENSIANESFRSDCQKFSGEIVYIGFISTGLFPGLDQLPINRQMKQTASLSKGAMTINSIWVEDLRVINQLPSIGETTIVVGEKRYPFSVKLNNITVVPTYIGNQSFQLCLGELLENWLTPSADVSMLVLVPGIYPFSDLNQVVAMSDAFYANGIPFALGVVPIDDNMDYPAMTRFYQVLRYVQSRNGTILIHRPGPETVSDSDTALAEKMYAVMNKMVENKIYPLGLVTGENLFFDDFNSLTPLNAFSSGIIISDPTQATQIIPAGNETWALNRASLGIDLETVVNTQSQTRNFINYPISTAIVLSLPKDEAALTDQVEVINNKWLSLTDYKNLENYWSIGQNTIQSRSGEISLNGMPVSLAYNEEPVDDNYAYQKPPEYNLAKLFTAGNVFLLTVVGIIIVVFIIIVIFSRRIYLNKFRKIVDQDEHKKTASEEDKKE